MTAYPCLPCLYVGWASGFFRPAEAHPGQCTAHHGLCRPCRVFGRHCGKTSFSSSKLVNPKITKSEVELRGQASR